MWLRYACRFDTTVTIHTSHRCISFTPHVKPYSFYSLYRYFCHKIQAWNTWATSKITNKVTGNRKVKLLISRWWLRQYFVFRITGSLLDAVKRKQITLVNSRFRKNILYHVFLNSIETLIVLITFLLECLSSQSKNKNKTYAYHHQQYYTI